MEYEHVSESEKVVYELPKWAKFIVRFYAVVFLLGTIVVYAKLLYSATTKGQEWLLIVTNSAVTTYNIIIIASFAFTLVLILEILYGVGVYKLKRWTLPLILTYSFSTLLTSFLRLPNLNFTRVDDLVSLLIGIIFMSVVGYVSIKYRSRFTGSARKLLIQIPLLTVLLPFIIFVTLNQIFIDDNQINDSDLILEQIAVLEESKNAHYMLPIIDELSTRQLEEYEIALTIAEGLQDETVTNSDDILGYVNSVQNLTDRFIAASNRQAYQCPTLTNNYEADAPLCNLSDIRNLALLTSLRAFAETNIGNSDQSLETSMSIVRMGNLLSNSEQPILIEHIVGIALMRIGLESIERTIDSKATTSDEVLINTADELQDYMMHGTALSTSLQKEYMSTKESLRPFEKYSQYFYQHNKTVNDLAELTRKQMEVAVASCGDDYSRKLKQLESYVDEEQKDVNAFLLISPNGIGEILKGGLMASLGSVRGKECELNTLNETVRDKIEMKLAK